MFWNQDEDTVTLSLGNLVIQNGKPPLPTASFGGAAVSLSDESSLRIDKVNFKSNGRAIDLAGAKATISNSQFSGHTMSAVRFINADVSISSCTFKGNRAEGTTNELYGGGAIWAYFGYTKLVVSKTTFESNYAAKHGGAVNLLYSAKATFRECTFKKNIANFEGGAIALPIPSDLTLIKCTFSGNQAKNGGALRLRTTKKGIYSIYKTSFSENVGINARGAFTATGDGFLNFCQSTFKSNTGGGKENNALVESGSTIYTNPFSIIPSVKATGAVPVSFQLGNPCTT